MILVNYLEPAIYRMAGVDKGMGCRFSLSHREREGLVAVGGSLDGDSADGPIAGIPDWRRPKPSRAPHFLGLLASMSQWSSALYR